MADREQVPAHPAHPPTAFRQAMDNALTKLMEADFWLSIASGATAGPYGPLERALAAQRHRILDERDIVRSLRDAQDGDAAALAALEARRG